MKRDEFSGFHPAVNFVYFLMVLVFSMAFAHPVMLVISLSAAIGYAVCLKGRRAVRFQLTCLLPLGLLTMALNPIFNHEGATILFWLPDGNPMTLEAVLYGGAAALMLAAAVTWFACVNEVLTSDKFIWLFGRTIPALSLVLSMALRFVPRFTARMKAVSAARAGAGYGAGGGAVSKVKNGLTVLSVVVTWALENAIETADSMKSRGYGLPGRTAFSVYRWEKRDSAALLFLLYCGGYIIAGAVLGGIDWRYYPLAGGELSSPYAVSIFLAYLALCALPLYLRGKESVKWKSIPSAT